MPPSDDATRLPKTEAITAARRRLAGIRILGLAILIGLVLGAGIAAALGRPAEMVENVFVVGALGLGAASLALASFRCPRCKRPFLQAWYRGAHIWSSWTCQECGLALKE
jgi:hypothetical protein